MALMGRSPDEAPPPGHPSGPSSNVSALAGRGSRSLRFPAGPRSPGLGLRVPSFAGVSSGRWWPNLGVVTGRCRVVTAVTMIMLINGLIFSGLCLLAVCSLPVAERFSVILLKIQNRNHLSTLDSFTPFYRCENLEIRELCCSHINQVMAERGFRFGFASCESP